MLLLTTSQAQQISGGTVQVAGYSFATPNVNSTCASLLASASNYDHQAGNLIGYNPNGYQTNPFQSASVRACTMNEYFNFQELMLQAVPGSLVATTREEIAALRSFY